MYTRNEWTFHHVDKIRYVVCLNRIWEQSNQVDSNFGAYGGTPSNGPQSAFAGASFGPNGGYQAAHISPVRMDIYLNREPGI
jgi:hypothetical protein